MGMKPIESVALAVMLAFLIAPWFIVGLNIWGWLFVCIAALVIGFELYSTVKNGKTISQIFWKFREEHKWGGNIVLIISSLGWLFLVLHLLRIP